MDSSIDFDLSAKYGSFVTPMSTPRPCNPDSVFGFVFEFAVVGLEVEEEEEREDRSSEAKISIITRRCSKAAGFGALSAFWVARRRRRRFGRGVGIGSESRACVAMRRWARVGGLKEESRM